MDKILQTIEERHHDENVIQWSSIIEKHMLALGDSNIVILMRTSGQVFVGKQVFGNAGRN